MSGQISFDFLITKFLDGPSSYIIIFGANETRGPVICKYYVNSYDICILYFFFVLVAEF